MTGSNKSWKQIDILGACLSLLCLVHCALPLVLPFLVASLPWLKNEMLHFGLLALVAPVAIWAITQGCRKHGNRRILVMGVISLVLLFAAVFSGEALEKPLTFAGSILLFFTHLQNRKCQMDYA